MASAEDNLIYVSGIIDVPFRKLDVCGPPPSCNEIGPLGVWLNPRLLRSVLVNVCMLLVHERVQEVLMVGGNDSPAARCVHAGLLGDLSVHCQRKKVAESKSSLASFLQHCYRRSRCCC